MTDKVQKIRQEIEKRLKCLEEIKLRRELAAAEIGDIACCKYLLSFINSLQEEPVSDDERIRKQTLKVLNYYKDEEKSEGRMPTEINECIAWLKSLGDRVKDKELTWEDIRDILDLYDEVTSMDCCSDIYGEVLKRFKDLKK